MEILGKYRNGNYIVEIWSDGTKVRKTEEDDFIPAFAENCDVKITDRCDGGCPFCYEGCTVEGAHADLFKWKFLKDLHPFTELALNGNDLSHPDLEPFLVYLKAHKVIANMTVNQKHFMKYYEKLKDWSDRGLIHGLGISLIDPTIEFLDKVQTIPNVVIHVINGIWTKAQRVGMMNRGLKVLILGYKELRRGEDYLKGHVDDILLKKRILQEDLKEMINEGWFKVVSFDNLALSQLHVKETLFEGKESEWNEFFMGEDGKYTFYLDLVKGEYAKNSLDQRRFPIGDLTIDEMFQHVRTLN